MARAVHRHDRPRDVACPIGREEEDGLRDLGGAPVHHDWGDLPWRVYTDPSGNVLCLLLARQDPVTG